MLTILIAAQVIAWNGPKLSPAEAARILAASPGTSNWTHVMEPIPDGPTVTVIPGSVTAGPFGELPYYQFPPMNCCYSYGSSWYSGWGYAAPVWDSGFGGNHRRSYRGRVESRTIGATTFDLLHAPDRVNPATLHDRVNIGDLFGRR